MHRRNLWKLIFALYCAGMLFLLFGRSGYDPALPYQTQLKYNLAPFQTIRLFARLLDASDPGLRKHAVINLAGNVVMFIPLGFCLPTLWEKLRKYRKTLLATVLIICAVELLQLVTLLGSCDTDDLLLNVLGASLGYALFRLAGKHK